MLTVCIILFSGFPTLNDVRANGAMMMQTKDFDRIELTLYPSMTFTCSGNITKLRFLALRDEVRRMNDHVLNIELAILDQDEDYRVPIQDVNDFSNANHTEGSGTGYEANFNCGEMEFHAGYVLAVRQEHVPRLKLLYEMGEKINGCHFRGTYWQGKIMCNKSHYRPLVTVETGIY